MKRARVVNGLAQVPCAWGCSAVRLLVVKEIPALPHALLVKCPACELQAVVICFGGEVAAARFESTEGPS